MLIDVLLKKAEKGWFCSTLWHNEAVGRMAEAAGVSKSTVIRKAIEFMAVNFDKSIFVDNTVKKSDSLVEQVTGTSRVNPRPAFGRNVGRGSSKRVHVSSIPGRER